MHLSVVSPAISPAVSPAVSDNTTDKSLADPPCNIGISYNNSEAFTER